MDVANYYQNLANMMNFGLLDELEVLPLNRTRIINLWRAIEPFVVVERNRSAPARSMIVLEVLEKYAIRAGKLEVSESHGDRPADHLAFRPRLLHSVRLLLGPVGGATLVGGQDRALPSLCGKCLSDTARRRGQS